MINSNLIIQTCRILGLMLIGFSATFIPPLGVAFYYQEKPLVSVFLISLLITVVIGLFLWFPFRHYSKELQARQGFLIVTLLWISLSLIGACPFILSNIPNISFIDAFFETISGLTTTGSSVFTHLSDLPRSILYYRQQLQFIGGGGIIILGIAILPMLSIGGMQLFRAEITGPFKEEKLAPRVTETAKTLWLIYLSLAALCAVCYWIGGMTVFESIGYSFSTISTGGFGLHDNNFGSFHNPFLEVVCVVFMFLGAINFSLLFLMVRRRSVRHFWQDPEFRIFLIFWLSIVVLVSCTLLYYQVFKSAGTTFVKSLFQVTSCFTTTGFFSEHFNLWPTYVPMLLMFICLIGGCSGSTAGGIKMIRFLIIKLQGIREIKRLIHPHGHYVIKLGYSQLHHRTLESILGFFSMFVTVFVVLLLLLLATGLDLITAFSALISSISNAGVGLGNVADNFKSLNNPAKVIASIAMLAGRLELFTLLVLLTPSYWRN